MSDDMDLSHTDIEESLRASVRALLRKRATPERVIALFDGDRAGTAELWNALAIDLGLAGLLVPEDLGGAGATEREAAVVLEELGRFVAPVPFLTSAVVATTALRAVGSTELLTSLASGMVIASVAVPFSTGPRGAPPTVTEQDGKLGGMVSSVAGALEATRFLVPVAGGGGLELHVVRADSTWITPVVSLDMTRQLADVDLTGATSELLAVGDLAEAAITRALVTGAALMASEQLGVAQWCLQATVDYLGKRRQFGRIVGSFQALKHRLADLYFEVESACAAARYAAIALTTDDPDYEIAAAVAQAYCANVAVHAAEECIQLHGGIGMTWEHPAHLYLKRAKADQIALGTPGAHHMRLAELVNLPAAVGVS